jgi:hypothetical protein
MPALNTFDMTNVERRFVSRPESERNYRFAFSQFRPAAFTNRGPFPECSLL